MLVNLNGQVIEVTRLSIRLEGPRLPHGYTITADDLHRPHLRIVSGEDAAAGPANPAVVAPSWLGAEAAA